GDDAHLALRLVASLLLEADTEAFASDREEAVGAFRVTELREHLIDPARVEWVLRDRPIHVGVRLEVGRNRRFGERALAVEQPVAGEQLGERRVLVGDEADADAVDPGSAADVAVERNRLDRRARIPAVELIGAEPDVLVGPEWVV